MHIDGFRGNYVEDTTFDPHTFLSLHFSLNTSLLREFTLTPFVWCFSRKPSHQASSLSSFQGATKGTPWNFYNLLQIFTFPPISCQFLSFSPKILRSTTSLPPLTQQGTPNEVPLGLEDEIAMRSFHGTDVISHKAKGLWSTSSWNHQFASWEQCVFLGGM